MPFASFNETRCLIPVDNLVSFIKLCIGDERSFNETYVVRGAEERSTKDVVVALFAVLDTKILLFRMPNKRCDLELISPGGWS